MCYHLVTCLLNLSEHNRELAFSASVILRLIAKVRKNWCSNPLSTTFLSYFIPFNLMQKETLYLAFAVSHLKTLKSTNNKRQKSQSSVLSFNNTGMWLLDLRYVGLPPIYNNVCLL